MNAWMVWLAVLGLVVATPFDSANAQLEENLGGLTDTNVEGYMKPLSTGVAGTMSSAIFRTGKIPKSGFTFSIGAASMAVGYDSDDETYLPDDPDGFTSLEDTQVPTVVGSTDGATVAGESDREWLYPGGFGMDGFQLAVPEVTLGAVAGTLLKGRWIAVDIGDADIGEFEYIGFGAQHSITQYMQDSPVDVAVGFFFQSFEIGKDIVNVNAWHLNVTGSMEFGFVQPYVGIGYDALEMDVNVDDSDGVSLVDVTLEDETSAHFTVGASAGIPAVSAFFEFNAAAATGFSLGLAFGM